MVGIHDTTIILWYFNFSEMQAIDTIWLEITEFSGWLDDVL